jgi:hypothetical protein
MHLSRKSNTLFDQESILSSDYYLKKCGELRIRTLNDFISATQSFNSNNQEANLFISGRDAMVIFDAVNVQPTQSVNIFVHHSDLIPPNSSFNKMSRLGYKLFSLNWMGDLSICKPIPIGIPSEIHSLGEAKRKFMKALEKQLGFPTQPEFLIYLNFDVTTNLRVRKPILEKMYRNGSTFIPSTRLSPEEHYSIVSRSKYVISPPGAGSDCFRTWESLYLGAIPVVFREHWPFMHLELPVKIIDDIEEIIYLNDSRSVQKSCPALQDNIADLKLKFG